MFTQDFYPTPGHVIDLMMQGHDVTGKTILEPSAGKGNIVEWLYQAGAANVIACELSPDLRKIVATKCPLIGMDFLEIKSDQISHVDYIVMNPPFSAGDSHINHAWDIAPPGCKIIALCNRETVKNAYSRGRKVLASTIEQFGQVIDLGDCFTIAERKTGVEVALVTLTKPGASYEQEFSGFFMDEDPEEQQSNGIMSYNAVRDLVNRYVAAIKLYDEQLSTGKKMHNLLSSFYGDELTFTCTEKGAPKLREDFKKGLQKAGWKYIFEKMNLTKFTTRGVREDINKFVEQQTAIPFTMRNIYHMLDIVVQTAGQRMDKAIIEVFDRVTERHHDNRYQMKGWKTNSHFLVGRKFILPYMINPAKEYGFTSDTYNHLKNGYDGIIPDFEKALCYITGKPFESEEFDREQGKWVRQGINTVSHSINRNYYGDWYSSEFFRYKGYKNGNMHFEFISEEVWQLFNRTVARIKGYPLFEGKEQTAYQKRQTGRTTPKAETMATQEEDHFQALDLTALFS